MVKKFMIRLPVSQTKPAYERFRCAFFVLSIDCSETPFPAPGSGVGCRQSVVASVPFRLDKFHCLRK